MKKAPKFFLKFSECNIMSSKNQHSYKFKEFRLDVAERQLLHNENAVSLTPKVFDVLAVLVEHGGHLVEKDELLRLVWEDAFVEESNIARAVHSLRKTLRENKNNKFIETVPKRGYRFVAEVEKVNGFSTEHNGSNGETEITKHEDFSNYVPQTDNDLLKVKKLNGNGANGDSAKFASGIEEDRRKPVKTSGKLNSKMLFAGVFLFLGIIATAIWFNNNLQTAKESEEIRSIAVLPLKPIDSESRDPIYELGIAESLILKLNSAKDLTVRPLSATRDYSELNQNPIQAGIEQEVDFVLSSNYQLANGQILVTSQLINVKTGQVEEIFKSEKNSSNVFSMQDEIANDIGNNFLAKFGNEENKLIAKRGTSNEKAYRLYLQATYIFEQVDKSDVGKAIDYLEEAVELDPNYAQAYSALAYAYRFFGHKSSASAEEQYLKSKKAVEKALELNEDLADAHAVLASMKWINDSDFEGAEQEYKKAIESDPDSSLVHAMYSNYLTNRGRLDEAIKHIKIAIEINPSSISSQTSYGTTLYYAHRYDEAIAQFKRIIEKDHDFAYSYLWMWLLYDLKEDEAKAYEWFMKYQTEIKSEPEKIQNYQTIYKNEGWKGILRQQIINDKNLINGQSRFDLYYEMACFSAKLGDKDKAFEYLNKAYDKQNSAMFLIKIDPYLDSLHDDPRFDKLVKQLKL